MCLFPIAVIHIIADYLSVASFCLVIQHLPAPHFTYDASSITMAPPFPEAKITLDYPLYACDFDPQDANRLFVAGGGGSSRTGVGNKITLVDVASTSHDALETAGEVTLSRDEDNVTALVAGQRKGKATLLYAGINSADDDLQKGKNEHFRVFAAEQPKSKSVLGARISEVNRSSLFTTYSPDTYQRLLRLTQPFGGAPQLGAVATGFAKEAQIALFDVVAGLNVAPKPRGVLNLKKEAVDMDVIQTADNLYQLMYCDDYNIYTLDLGKAGLGVDAQPKCIYTMPTEDIRPSLRCIRYLSQNFALAVANLPRPGGVVLYGFRLPKAGKTDTAARIAVNTRVSKSQGVKATGLAVANLSPVASAGATQGEAQYVIAIASNDFSVHLYSLDHQVIGDVNLLANLYPLRTLKNVHPAMITNLSFSHFAPPKSGTGRTQHLKLASTSVSNSVVVQSIPLKKHFDKATKTRRGGPPRHPRYVTALEGRAPSPLGFLLFWAGVVLVLAVFLQGVLEVKGLSGPVVGGHRWLPSSMHAVPASAPGPHSGSLVRLLSDRGDGTVLIDTEETTGKVMYSELAAGAEDDGSRRSWEELGHEQRELWKERLKKSGYWAEEMGEVVLKGILFGELAGAVGAIVGG